MLKFKTLALLLSLFVAWPCFAQPATDEDDVESELNEMEIDAEEEDDGSIVESVDPEPQDVELTAPTEPAPTTPTTPAPSRQSYTPSNSTTSDGTSQKVFDWKKYEGAREVPHPFAEKGLIKVTKDRTYVYRVDETKQSRAASFRIGVFNPVNLENPDAVGQEGSTFEENYDQTTNPAIMFDYEWQLWRMPVGKIGVRVGSGIYIAQGNGHFVSETNRAAGRTPREIFTFWAMPNSLGAVYRLQFWDKQLLIPYAEGGGIAFAFGEFRDDDKAPKWGGAFASYYAAGVAFNLTYFDALSRIQLDREYGINRVYLTAEYRGIVGLSENYDFSSDLINGGFLMEF